MLVRKDKEGDITSKFEITGIKVPLFNLCALLYETDLYSLWFPFNKRAEDFKVVSPV
jgi:hypothetical protein